MKPKLGMTLLLTLMLLSELTACSKSENKAESNLKQALATAPADTFQMLFTDWALIKEHMGVPNLNSKSNMDLRTEFMIQAFVGKIDSDIPPRHAAPSGFGVNWFREHAESWGWDSTDLVWEATIDSESKPPAYVLQFPNDFDFAPLMARLKERGFSQQGHQGATVFSHEMDLKADWLRTTELAIVNTAVLQDDKILVISADLEIVLAILNVIQGDAQSLADVPAAMATTDRLGVVDAALIEAGPDVCLSFSEDPLQALVSQEATDEQLAQLKALLQETPSVRAYTALGVGYRYGEKDLIGLLVMHYADADDAQADLKARRQLAQEGISIAAKQPYSKILFTLDEASIPKGSSDLVLRVSPIDGIPRRLFDMVFRQDMLFAKCP